MIVTAQPALELSFIDASRSVGAMRLWLPISSASQAGMRAAIAAAIAAIPTECVMTDANLRVSAEIIEPDEPMPGATRELCGVLIFECSLPGQFLTIAIPGIRPAMILPDGMTLDRENAAIRALTDGVIALGLCNPSGYPAAYLYSAIAEWRIV
jgi:hypothetical protein